MRRITVGILTLALASGLGTISATTANATAAPPTDPETVTSVTPDELSNPLEEKRRAENTEAVQQVINGEVTPVESDGSTVVKLEGSSRTGAQDSYVEIAREKTDKIFVILTEFGDQRDPRYPDQDTDPTTPGPATFDGPLHNAIPEPDRAVDNSTVWQADYSQQHYQDLYFGTGDGVESLKTYYETQSSGRYSVDGTVSDWVKVPYNEARYGRSDGYPCASNVCSNTWQLLADGLTQWVADQKAAGQTDAQIAASVAEYDQWDRYDFDGDGDFNEPDGYIDHFQVVHAGGDQADGDPYQGEDAIWSHRWYAFQGGIGNEGPAGNLLGGTQIGTTGIWVGDYTIQPENGGLSVFAHEYGHDLGLPDDYDTTGAGSNNNEWWTLMSQSRLGAAGDALGEKPGDIGAWQKLQLGWLDYETIVAGQNRTLDLGPAEYNSAKAQAAVVVLPKKEVTTELPAPFAGDYEWWSGQGDDLDAILQRGGRVGTGTTLLTFKAQWNIEDCGPDPCDYAYVEVNDGSGWDAIPGSITNPDEGNGIDGVSDGWTDASFDLSAYANQTVQFRLRYTTDGAVQGQDPAAAAGIFVDEIKVTRNGRTGLSDGAETEDPGWTVDGFTRTTGTETAEYDNYYIAANRSYVSYDRYLETGPYNFGFPDRPDYTEHFPYQQGLMISYWDSSQGDNNVSQHPGEGRNLYVDAHPRLAYNLDGTPWRNRIQLYDAPFSLMKADSLTLHNQVTGRESYLRGQAAQPLFDDTRSYVDTVLPEHSLILRNAGVTMRVLSQDGTSMSIRVGSKTPRG